MSRSWTHTYLNAEDRMRLAVELSRETNKLSAPGVNLVLASGNSFAHAKMVAIMVAHQLVGDFDWAGRGSHLTSWSPAPSLAPCALARSPGSA